VAKYGTARQITEDIITGRRKDAICKPDNQDKNIYTHSKYLLVIAFPRQQLLCERA